MLAYFEAVRLQGLDCARVLSTTLWIFADAGLLIQGQGKTTVITRQWQGILAFATRITLHKHQHTPQARKQNAEADKQLTGTCELGEVGLQQDSLHSCMSGEKEGRSADATQ